MLWWAASKIVTDCDKRGRSEPLQPRLGIYQKSNSSGIQHTTCEVENSGQFPLIAYVEVLAQYIIHSLPMIRQIHQWALPLPVQVILTLLVLQRACKVWGAACLFNLRLESKAIPLLLTFLPSIALNIEHVDAHKLWLQMPHPFNTCSLHTFASSLKISQHGAEPRYHALRRTLLLKAYEAKRYMDSDLFMQG